MPDTPSVAAPAAVELHAFSLDHGDDVVRSLGSLLDASEIRRAGAFRFERDRRRWVVARGSLRLLLGRRLRQPPGALAFLVTPAGKPRLAPPWQEHHFSVAHSGSRALIGCSLGEPLGVDLESEARGAEVAECAAAFLSPAERAVARPDSADGRRRLVRIWCAKEAYLKALGTGFLVAPDTFTVSWQGRSAATIHDASGTEASYVLHFPPVPDAPHLCSAVALPARVPCPPIRPFAPDRAVAALRGT